MNVLPLILASGMTIIYPDPVDPTQYQVWGDYPERTERMAERTPLSRATRLVDAAFQGNPTLQRGPYQFPDDNSYPLRTVVPRNQRQVVPLEEEMAMRDYDLQQTKNNLAIQGAMFDQTVQQKNYQYDQNVLSQAEAATQKLGELDPLAEDFPTQVAALQRDNPLAFQNQGFLSSLGRLQATNNNIRENDQILARQQQAEEDRLKRAEITEGRRYMSKYGPSALARYEESLQQNPDMSPIQVAASIEASQQEQSTRAALRDAGVNESRFFTPIVDTQGQPTGEERFDTARATEYLRGTPSTANINSVLNTLNRISTKNQGIDRQDWTQEDRMQYDLASQLVNQYQTSRGNLGTSENQPTVITAPNAAVELLKKNPSLADQFDAKYGAGASKKYLQ